MPRQAPLPGPSGRDRFALWFGAVCFSASVWFVVVFTGALIYAVVVK